MTRIGVRELEQDDVRVNTLMQVDLTRLIGRIPDDHVLDTLTRKRSPQSAWLQWLCFRTQANRRAKQAVRLQAASTVSIHMTDPELRAPTFREGDWTVKAIAEKVSQLIDMQDKVKTETRRTPSQASLTHRWPVVTGGEVNDSCFPAQEIDTRVN